VKTLPDHLELLGADLERAARGLVRERRQRRRRVQLVALVAAIATVGTGVGLAASGFDVFAWVRSADDPTEIRYFVDTTRRYEGAAPETIECESVRGESFVCRALPAGPFECPPARRNTYPCSRPAASQRIYWLSYRVENAPRITRDRLTEELEAASDEGMSPRLERRFRAAFADVSDEFIAKFDLLMRIQGGRSYHEDEDGNQIAPPAGVPLEVTCEGTAGTRTLRCRDVAGATDIPVGAPIYSLEPTADWVEVDRGADMRDGWGDIESFFGRPLSDDETLVFIFLGLASDDMTESEWAEIERGIERLDEDQ
jgi:hypothetical protein